MRRKEKPIGFDLVDVKPRFGWEIKEEYWERHRKCILKYTENIPKLLRN